jgi:thioredoxin reductase
MPMAWPTWIALFRSRLAGRACLGHNRGHLLETSQPGIFVVGDVRSGSGRRVAAAVGEGAMAIGLALEKGRPA